MTTQPRWLRFITFLLLLLIWAAPSAEAQYTITFENLLTHLKVGWSKLAAVEAAQVAQSVSSLDREFLEFCGLILMANNRNELARQVYGRLLSEDEITAHERGTYNNLIGRSYYLEADYLEAERYYRQGLEDLGDQLIPLVDLAIITISHAELDEAKGYLDRAEQLNESDYLGLKLAHGDYAKAVGDLQRALDYYQQIIDKEPDNLVALRRMRQIYAQLGQTDKEAETLEREKALVQ